MNICFFNLPEHSGAAMKGGFERATSLLAKELRRRGHSVEFYSYEPPHRFHIPLISSFLLPALFPSFSKRTEKVHFLQFLKKNEIDVAVWHGGGGWSIPFPLKDLPCELITACHVPPNYDEQIYADRTIKRLRLNSRIAKRFIKSKPCRFLIWKFYEVYRYHFFYPYVLHHCDKFVLLSEGFFSDFTPMKKFPEKVCAIPNIAPYEAQNISFNEKKKELLWLARVEFTQKRPDFMLRIWQRLQDIFSDWSLRFVGDGDYLPELKKNSSSLGLKNVFFEGFQDPTPYYRSASIFCMTSTFEGFGLTLVEAQAFGCVPVAFESFSAVRDIIDDGVSGFLVPPFDLDAYTDKLSSIMSNTELLKSIAHNAQNSAVKFSPMSVGDGWNKLLIKGGGQKTERPPLGRQNGFLRKAP